MAEDKAKYRVIFEALQRGIRNGDYPPGTPLPSETALRRKYGVSRITAVRAMDELVKNGLVVRRRGAGSFVSRLARTEGGQIGLIVPSLSQGEVFPRLVQSLTRFAQRDGYACLLGDFSGESAKMRAHEACRVARTLVKRKVAGVIMQPLAFLKTPERITRNIISYFDKAGIPVVLLDRDIESDVGSAHHDFVGIDNFRAGRELGGHLVECGAKRVHILMRPQCASVIRDRMDGVVGALGRQWKAERTIVAEPDDVKAIEAFFRGASRPDAVVCESDYVAAVFGNTVRKLGFEVPKDVMLAGFDDVRCAVTASPPLTTIHQPCEDVARMAYQALRERIRDPKLPSRRILLPAALVARESTRKG